MMWEEELGQGSSAYRLRDGYLGVGWPSRLFVVGRTGAIGTIWVMTDPSLLRLVEAALYDPPGEEAYRGVADFSPDHASPDVLARGVMKALDDAGYVVLKKL